MKTSAILTIGLLCVWCSLCVDDKDKNDQRILGYALGFGLLFILVCKNLYSEDEECSTYEYATNQTPNGQTDDEKTDGGGGFLALDETDVYTLKVLAFLCVAGFLIWVFFELFVRYCGAPAQSETTDKDPLRQTLLGPNPR